MQKIFSVAVAALIISWAVPADAFDVFRGVSSKNSGRASLGPGTFRFNPTLSTFDLANRPAANCYVKITITGLPNNPPQVNDAGTVAGLPSTYTATFNNVPPGHWDIAPAGTTTNPPANEFSTWAQTYRTTVVVNGTRTNCN